MQKAGTLWHCPTWPGAVPVWFCMVIPLGFVLFWRKLEFGIKSCLRVWQTINISTENTRRCIKMDYNNPPCGQGQLHYGNSTGAVLSTGFGKLSYFGLAVWAT